MRGEGCVKWTTINAGQTLQSILLLQSYRLQAVARFADGSHAQC